MRVITFRWLVLMAVALSVSLAPAQTPDDFFDDSVVHELWLDVRPSDWAELKERFLDNFYYPAEFRWKFKGKEVFIPDIGIRSRGRGSRSPIKPNLRLDFNRYEPEQTFVGLSSAVLKANNQDASMLKERTVFKLFQRFGLPASREAHARLYINGEYLGLYLLTEEIRKEYLTRYLGEGNGDLFKFNPLTEGYRFEWRPACSGDQLACSTDPNKWAPEPFEPEENKATYDVAPMMSFVRTINQASDADFPQLAAELIDLKLWLAHVALENFVTDFDSILGDVFGMNNFFVYRYLNGKHQFLLWDKDASYSWATRPIFQNTEQNVLSRRALAIPARRAEYLEAAYKAAILAGGPGGWLEWENQREYTQIRDAVYEDKAKQYAESGVAKPSSNEIFEAEFQRNLQFARERAPFVLDEVFRAGFQPGSSIRLNEAVADETGVAAAQLIPGATIILSGSGFAGTTAEAASDVSTITLAGVAVIINGFNASLISVSPSEIKLRVPSELGFGTGKAPITVFVNGSASKGVRPGSPIDAAISNTVIVPVAQPQ
jgi:spore coat protein CotH